MQAYFDTLTTLIKTTAVTSRDGQPLALDRGLERLRAAVHKTHNLGSKIMFIGDGGRAGIASHLGIDFAKNGGLRSLASNDASALTSPWQRSRLRERFTKHIEFHARADDPLVAISSSGRSPNIVISGRGGPRPRLHRRDLLGLRRRQRSQTRGRRQLLHFAGANMA